MGQLRALLGLTAAGELLPRWVQNVWVGHPYSCVPLLPFPQTQSPDAGIL